MVQASRSTATGFCTGLASFERWLCYCFITVMLFQIVVLAQHTFAWRYGEDVGFFYYFSWLANERGYLPYRDLHETSFPGSFLLYGWITRIGGYSVLAYNITHMLLFIALCTASYCWLSRINRRMALVATLLFGSQYFFMHRSMHMQRDFLVLLLVLAAIAVMTSQRALAGRSMITGLLFGLAAAVKPHAALAAPVVVVIGTLASSSESGSAMARCIRAAALSLAAFVALWLAIVGWLFATGAWPYFFSMLMEYMPLYQAMNGVHIAQTDSQRWQNALDWFSGHFLVGAITAVAGGLFCWRNPVLDRRQKWLVALLLLLWPLFLFYVAAGGKFWDYHQIPMHYFYSAMLCLLFIPFAVHSWRGMSLRVLYLCLAALFMQGAVSPDYALAVACLRGDPVCDTEEQSAYAIEDRLEHFLRTHVPADERVEPLATSTLGPLFPALLRAGVEPATPYAEGFPLYHDGDKPYIQKIRTDMLSRLQQKPPRFMVRPVNFFAPGGDNASAFTGLDAFINSHYQRVDEQRYPELNGLPVDVYEIISR